MNDVDNRLRDLRRATQGRIRPSPELLSRIEASVSPRTWWRWPMAMAIGAMTVIVATVALLQGGTEDEHVASRPPTQAEFGAAMNQRCAEFVAETDSVVLLFATPEAYALAAENRISALTRSLERLQSVGAPAGSPGLLLEVRSQAARAQGHARAALDAAQAGDTARASAELQQFDDAVNGLGTLLADYGAEQCRPREAP